MEEQQTCECSEEYGPCKDHGEILAEREGARSRSADQLAHVYLEDLVDILTSAGLVGPATKVQGYFEDFAKRPVQGSWFADLDDSEGIHDIVSMVETWLPPGIVTYWGNGYHIARVHEDSPLNE